MTITPELTAPPGTEPAERGRLDISPTVLRKIVEHAVDGAPGTLPGTRKVAGVGVGQTGSTAKVAVGDDLVDIKLDLVVRYPGSVPKVIEQLRERVIAEVDRITGHRVRMFDVTVSGLHREQTSRLI
ncbi:Asp23/Gls24 family envelope stress response protein [Pseudonocardia spinosispora]|uniref:Asp23/Gls24 family envelope stress response protein n=1 Tax=Pseudonocardia spinosispora TaxID=103441 RepID=UPI00041F04B9|nr:Asp23/Gls24 family envelope stress response protein [Pseudonocardia spinosispora]